MNMASLLKIKNDASKKEIYNEIIRMGIYSEYLIVERNCACNFSFFEGGGGGGSILLKFCNLCVRNHPSFKLVRYISLICRAAAIDC